MNAVAIQQQYQQQGIQFFLAFFFTQWTHAQLATGYDMNNNNIKEKKKQKKKNVMLQANDEIF